MSLKRVADILVQVFVFLIAMSGFLNLFRGRYLSAAVAFAIVFIIVSVKVWQGHRKSADGDVAT